MKAYFILYGDFRSPSAMHIFHLANALAKLGCPCIVAANGFLDEVQQFGSPRFRVEDYSRDKIKSWRFHPGPGDIIHAWTPRERVRKVVATLQNIFPAPYIVHMEDNEERILSDVYKQPFEDLAHLPDEMFPATVRDSWILPRTYKSFLAQAQAVTCIYESLAEFVPEGVETMTFWAACEPEIFQMAVEPNLEIRRKLGIADHEIVLVYPGAVHACNVGEMTAYYEAIVQLRAEGVPVRLVRLGNPNRFDDNQYPGVIYLGDIPTKDIPLVLAAADILVQPGGANDFNDYRFPCKLPMFLASGRPVVLPRTNIGHHLEDGENCLLLETGSKEELASAIRQLIQNPLLRRRIGENGRLFAQEHFSWQRNAEKVLDLYTRVLARWNTASIGS